MLAVAITAAIGLAALLWRFTAHSASSTVPLSLPDRPRDYYSSATKIALTLLHLALKHMPFSGVAALPRELTHREGFEPYIELPRQVISAPYSITPDDIALFRRLARTPSAATVAGNVDRLILVPLAVPLIPAILASRLNPLMPLGSVNVRNTFKWYPGADELLEGASEGKYRAVADAGGSDEGMRATRVKRGLEWSTVIRIIRLSDDVRKMAVDSTSAEERGETVFEFTFTSLNAIPKHQLALTPSIPSSSGKAILEETDWIIDPEPLKIKDEDPSLYASLSRDYNPIHMSTILAKLFGFKRKIAHGNLVVALACQRAAASTVPDTEGMEHGDNARLYHAKTAFAALLNEKDGSVLHMAFKRPVFVPSVVRLRWSADGTRAEVYEELRSGTKVLVEMSLERL